MSIINKFILGFAVMAFLGGIFVCALSDNMEKDLINAQSNAVHENISKKIRYENYKIKQTTFRKDSQGKVIEYNPFGEKIRTYGN